MSLHITECLNTMSGALKKCKSLHMIECLNTVRGHSKNAAPLDSAEGAIVSLLVGECQTSVVGYNVIGLLAVMVPWYH